MLPGLPMRICPTCKSAYPTRGTQSTCPRDGTPLVDAAQFAAERSDPLIGATLAGRFRIVARVGTGGMGTVYRAEQAGLSRQVALKVLKRELVIERETVARFHREAKAMSMLLHPNTVRVFDFGEDPATGHLFLAMELLEGELLTARLDREGVLDVREAISFVQEILRSLHEAHSKGIVHRDLKPDNIFLARIEGHAIPVVKVLDFGIAKVWREEGKIDQLETQAGTVFGTPRYMSPEQAQGKALDPRSDLYSVGILLFQLLTGRPPFVDEDAVVVMAKHIRDRPEAPRRAAPDRPIPASLERVVLRSMEKDPEDRYASADEFERALGAVLADVDAAKAALESGRRPMFVPRVADLPRVPLAIGAGVVGVAMVVAVVMVASAGSGAPPVETATELTVIDTGTAEPAAPSTPPPAAIAVTPTTTRHVVVDSEPPGAEVWRDGSRVGTTPHALDVGASEHGTLELRLDGHESATLELASAASTQTVTLVPQRRVARRGSGSERARPARETATPEPTPVTATTVSAPPPRPQRDPYERFD
ncbi:Hypothetical protein I5071_43040 [Sandaracinus amylolyticus]|nr:Hypothetical protein I5071_43040 [Sandaracinus amylolyticus]